MSLGPSAFVAASHVALIVALLILLVRIVRSLDDRSSREVISRGALPGLGVFAWAIVVERAYYVAARLLQPHGIDLWQMHPAPQILSMLLVGALYALKVPFVLAQYARAAAIRSLLIEVALIACLWGGVSWLLY